MGCISQTTRTALLARKATFEAGLTRAETALEDAMTGHESYRLDTGEGSQQVKQRSVEELQKAIDWYEARIAAIDRRLRGSGVINMTVRRRPRRSFRHNYGAV